VIPLALAAALALAQPADSPKADPPKPSVDDLVAAAVRNSDEVKIAEAQLVVAKQAVALRVTAAVAKVEVAK
jgi:hypothetical protein